jgi:uncharacterized protein YbjQ (UPF0145 family)
VELIIQLGIFLILIGFGLFLGSATERRHLRELDRREAENSDFLIAQTATFAEPVSGDLAPMLIVGEAVIATDYLKSFLSGLRKIFGGELRSYQSLLTRARREALQRIVDQARQRGFNALCNLRYDSADVGGNTTAKRVATVAILASATAYRRAAVATR